MPVWIHLVPLELIDGASEPVSILEQLNFDSYFDHDLDFDSYFNYSLNFDSYFYE